MRHGVIAAFLLLTTSAMGQEAVNPYFRFQTHMSPIFFGDDSGTPPTANPNNPDADLVILAAPGAWRADRPISFPVSTDPYDGDLTLEFDGLPFGLAWDAGSGHVMGTSSAGAAPYLSRFDVRAMRAGIVAKDAAFDIAIYPKLEIATIADVEVDLGDAISVQPVASGVVGTPLWSSIGTAIDLPGLGLSSTGGTLSGTPTEPGRIDGIVLQVEDDADAETEASNPFDIVVRAPAIAFALSDVRSRAGVPLTIPFAPTGGHGPITVTPDTTPPQMTVTASGATGSPPVGTHAISATAADAWTSRTASATVTIDPALVASMTPILSGPAGSPLSAQASATGVVGTLSWEADSSNLPAAVSLSSSGLLSGAFPPPGDVVIPFVTAVDSFDGSRSPTGAITLRSTMTPIAISALGGSVRSGRPVSLLVSVSGGYGALTVSASGPAGIYYGNGQIMGSTAAVGNHQIQITASNQYGSANHSIPLTVHGLPWITPGSSLSGFSGVEYSIAPSGAGNFLASATWSFAPGSQVPNGMSISSSTGVVSIARGTAAGVYSVALKATDAWDGAIATSTSFQVRLDEPSHNGGPCEACHW